MTVVPAAFQLTGWIPAWWRGTAGGDDLLDLVGPDAVESLADLRGTVVALTAYCPAIGVSALPGPRAVTESAVAAGEAVILHAAHRGPSRVLLPSAQGWTLVEADAARPCDLDLRSAAAEMAQAVVTAEHGLREARPDMRATPAKPTVRPLPPDAGPDRRGLLVRAVRLWTAVDAVPPARRTPELHDVLRTAARATLAAYMDPAPVPRSARRGHDRRPA